MLECYCPECGVIKCPRELWGGECDCEEGLCHDCIHERHDAECENCTEGEECPFLIWLEEGGGC